jgi:sugar (pentulose or hexulose) kinase
MLWGLPMNHGRGHVFRANIESVCSRHGADLPNMRGHDVDPRVNVVSGGSTKSDLWMQIGADVSIIPIAFRQESEGPGLGPAICGAVAAGMYPDIPTAIEGMVRTERTIEPSPERHAEYQFYFDSHIESYEQMKDVTHATVRHVNETRDAACAAAPARESRKETSP